MERVIHRDANASKNKDDLIFDLLVESFLLLELVAALYQLLLPPRDFLPTTHDALEKKL